MGSDGRATHGGCCRWAFVVFLARFIYVAVPLAAGSRSSARITGRHVLLGPAVAQTPSQWRT